MTAIISDNMLSGFSEFVAAHMGLHFPKKSWDQLESGIRSAAPELGFTDIESCIRWLQSSLLTKKQIETLASHLTVGETYFFREQKSFEILEEHIMPELIHARRKKDQRLRIWSAACCTGEEPYSIAILLDKILPDLKDWSVTILATDINPLFLNKASVGRYRKWSFRNTPSGIKKRYFKKMGKGDFEILPHIKKMVTFSYLNLAEDIYPSFSNNTNAMDVIFCRNVLMYFTPDYAKKVAKHLYSSLINGGWLVISPSESLHVHDSRFETVRFPDAILYRKKQKSEPSAKTFESTVSRCDPLTSVDPGHKDQQEVISPAQTASRQGSTEQILYPKTVEKLVDPFFSNQWEDNEGFPSEKAFCLAARDYADQGKLDEALTWCMKAIKADKLNPGNHYLHATILQEQDRVAEAGRSLKKALYLNPDFLLAHFALGNLARRQRKFKEADRHFENALSLLNGLDQEAVLPESEGITAGKLREMLRSIIED